MTLNFMSGTVSCSASNTSFHIVVVSIWFTFCMFIIATFVEVKRGQGASQQVTVTMLWTGGLSEFAKLIKEPAALQTV